MYFSAAMFPPFTEIPFTYILNALVLIFSITAFYYKPLYNALLFHPYEVFRGNRVHTLLTSALIHRGWKHLLINSYMLFFMSKNLEYIILETNQTPIQIRLTCLTLLLCSIAGSNFITGRKQKDNVTFTSIGISGATFAFMTFAMLYLPLDHPEQHYRYFPLYYGYQFALAILCIAVLLAFRKSANNHLVHLYGALTGCLFAVILRPVLISELIRHFQ